MQSDEITIAGTAFAVPVRYFEGHPLTAGEASALNQTYHENLRNNFASKVKKYKDENEGVEDFSDLQSELDTYAEAYQFGVRTPGVRVSADPVKREAINLAKAAIRKALAAAGKKATNEAITEAAGKLVEDPIKGASYLSVAKERVEAAKSIASDALGDLLSDIPEASEAEAA